MNNVGDSRPSISVIARDRRGANKKNKFCNLSNILSYCTSDSCLFKSNQFDNYEVGGFRLINYSFVYQY